MKRPSTSSPFLTVRVEMWESVLWISTFPHVDRVYRASRAIREAVGEAGRPSIRVSSVIGRITTQHGVRIGGDGAISATIVWRSVR